jgi:hypothetical protein
MTIFNRYRLVQIFNRPGSLHDGAGSTSMIVPMIAAVVIVATLSLVARRVARHPLPHAADEALGAV